MDLQTMLTNAVDASRAQSLKNSPQVSLGELIAKLEGIAEAHKISRVEKAEAEVYFDFEYLHPTGISSWRGSYSELALEFDGSKVYKLSEFIELLKSCIGKTFVGYKGGDFVMGKTTPVWVANYGNSGETGILGVKDNGYKVTLETGYCEY